MHAHKYIHIYTYILTYIHACIYMNTETQTQFVKFKIQNPNWHCGGREKVSHQKVSMEDVRDLFIFCERLFPVLHNANYDFEFWICLCGGKEKVSHKKVSVEDEVSIEDEKKSLTTCFFVLHRDFWDFDSRQPPPPGGVSYVAGSQTKNPEEEDPPIEAPSTNSLEGVLFLWVLG